MESLKEQIENKYIHFTGLMSKICNAEIIYDDIRIKSERPYKFPCIKNSRLHGGVCEKCEFPSDEKVKYELNEIQNISIKTIKVYSAVKEHHSLNLNVMHGIIECSECGGELQYSIAELNGHIHAKCNNCDLNFME